MVTTTSPLEERVTNIEKWFQELHEEYRALSFIAARAHSTSESAGELYGQIMFDLKSIKVQQAQHTVMLTEHKHKLIDLKETQDEHTRRLDGLKETQDEHTRRLDGLKETQDEHTRRLDGLKETQDEHTRRLDEHTEILNELRANQDEHTRRLDEHSAVLKDHTTMLQEILGLVRNLN